MPAWYYHTTCPPRPRCSISSHLRPCCRPYHWGSSSAHLGSRPPVMKINIKIQELNRKVQPQERNDINDSSEHICKYLRVCSSVGQRILTPSRGQQPVPVLVWLEEQHVFPRAPRWQQVFSVHSSALSPQSGPRRPRRG